MISKKLWRTAGYITLGLAFLMLYKGSEFEEAINHNDVIDAEYEIID